MGDWNTSAARPSASATSPTTSPAASSRPAASDPNYTLECDEPRDSEIHRARHVAECGAVGRPQWVVIVAERCLIPRMKCQPARSNPRVPGLQGR